MRVLSFISHSFRSVSNKIHACVFLGLADAALGEGTGVKLNKLSVREIKAVRVLPFLRFTLFLTIVFLFSSSE